MKKFVLGVFALWNLSLNAQTIYVKNHPLPSPQNIQNVASANAVSNQIYQGKAFCILQFNKAVSEKTRAGIEEVTGIQFFDYIPKFAFVASVPLNISLPSLSTYGITGIAAYNPDYKISEELSSFNFPAWIVKENNQLELEVEVHSSIPKTDVEKLFAANAVSFMSWRNEHKAIVRIQASGINTLANYPWIKYIQPTSAPAVTENLKERNNHRVNTIDNVWYGGTHYDGTGLSISEGDDGAIGFHIDFKGRLNNHSTDTNGTHGDHVAGIAAGGGNFDPTTSGNARGADLHVYDGYGNLNNAGTDYSANGVRITTNSLGQTCNDGYNSDAQISDQLILSQPSLMSVHSAGNSGGGTCGSVANGFYTITGGYKAGKNIISVGNVDNSDMIAASSSKGPAKDGRIKPEVVAVGTNVYSTQPNNNYTSLTGTSMACPATAGALASLWQSYRETHGNVDPRSDVMKAILMNTADDLGNVGPDYTYGYGRINARRAYEAIKNDHFMIDSTEVFNTNEHYVSVPPGVKMLKVMLYWHDVVGSTFTTYPIVNNLNLRMKDDNSNVYLPWVLNHSLNPASLALPAVRGLDSMNNVEQVTIDSIVAGDYAILVSGVDVPFGPQTYVITYELIYDSLNLTYPTGGEALVPDVTERVRWDAYGNNLGNFTLEYSTDAGAIWSTISSNIPDDVRYYDWTPPTGLSTGQTLMRISRGAVSDVTDTLFNIIDVPTNLVVDTACDNIFHLSWDSVANATGYKLYWMGNKYMTEIASSATNEYYLSTGVNLTDTFYFAVAAVNATTGAIGRRSTVFTKYPGELNCIDQIVNVETLLPFEVAYNCATSASMPVKVKLKNQGLKDVMNFPVSYQVNANPVVTENCNMLLAIGDSIIYTFATPANFALVNNYNVKTWMHIWTDTHLSDDTSSTTATVIAPVIVATPIIENFESPAFPPFGWRVLDLDTSVKWQKTICFSGATSGNTHAAYMDFYNYTKPDQVDDMETFLVDLTSSTMDSVIMSFDISAAYNSLAQDTLSIWVSSDCGKTFQQTPYNKWGTNLATVGSKPNIFSPTLQSQWRNDQIDLSAYKGGKVFIRFRGINRKGNNVYIDNINIIDKNLVPASTGHLESSHWSIFPNPSHDGLYTMSMNSSEAKTISYQVLNAAGQVVHRGEMHTHAGTTDTQINLSSQPSGMYMIELNDGSTTQKGKLTKF